MAIKVNMLRGIERLINARDIPNGEVFIGRIGDNRERVFRRMGPYIIAPDGDGDAYWDAQPGVQEYQLVDIEITVKPKA